MSRASSPSLPGFGYTQLLSAERMIFINDFKKTVHISGKNLYFSLSSSPLVNPAILIQPSLGLFLMAGETSVIRQERDMFKSVMPPDEFQSHPIIAVPLGLGNPYGLSLEQTEYIINRMSSDIAPNFVIDFYNHLCLDADIRVWIEEEMGRCKSSQ